MTKKGGLGKKLDNLLPDNQVNSKPTDIFFESKNNLDNLIKDNGGAYQEIDLELIRPNPKQPRRSFDPKVIKDISDSIKEVGVLQPIRVQQKMENGEKYYELIMGEQRTRASKLAGKTTIPAIIQYTENDELLRQALFENIYRSDLNPIEIALAYKQMIEDFGYTQEELSKKVNKSRPVIANYLRMLKLPPKVLELISKGGITEGHARQLIKLENENDIILLAEKIVEDVLSVSQTQEIVDSPNVANLELKNKNARAKKISKINPLIAEIQENLTEYLNTRVKIISSPKAKGHGFVNIEFGSLDDLERINSLINPE